MILSTVHPRVKSIKNYYKCFFFFFTTSRRSSTTTAAAAATDIDITVEPVTTDRVGLDVVTIQVH